MTLRLNYKTHGKKIHTYAAICFEFWHNLNQTLPSKFGHLTQRPPEHDVIWYGQGVVMVWSDGKDFENFFWTLMTFTIELFKTCCFILQEFFLENTYLCSGIVPQCWAKIYYNSNTFQVGWHMRRRLEEWWDEWYMQKSCDIMYLSRSLLQPDQGFWGVLKLELLAKHPARAFKNIKCHLLTEAHCTKQHQG